MKTGVFELTADTLVNSERNNENVWPAFRNQDSEKTWMGHMDTGKKILPLLLLESGIERWMGRTQVGTRESKVEFEQREKWL